ncbi:MAG: hypothetical protein EPO25_18295 [Gammaproteobacteria bacterium]|nr:MAG: hypothetical protein EPO25_18295 [Gammaproteobacteria bacterium]
MRGFLVILLYLAAMAAAIHALRRRPARRTAREPAAWLAAAALAVHAAWLAGIVRTHGGFALALADSASLLGWVIGAGGLVALFVRGFRGIAAILLGLAALLASGTGSLPQIREFPAPDWPLAGHMLLAMSAAGIFALAAVLALVLIVQDAGLRSRRPAPWLAMLPPIESLERALFLTIATGLAALSVAILAGFLFVTDLFAQHLAHKTALGLTAWLIFAVLLAGHWRFGWRGRRAATYTLTGFGILLLAYFGSKFVLEILLGRTWG